MAPKGNRATAKASADPLNRVDQQDKADDPQNAPATTAPEPTTNPSLMEVEESEEKKTRKEKLVKEEVRGLNSTINIFNNVVIYY